MCDSLDEGGTRCAAHTRPGFRRVLDTLNHTPPEQRADVRMGGLGEETNTQAVTAHASTPTGRHEVEDLTAALADTDPDTADWLHRCLKDGEVKAEAARAVKAQIAQQALGSAIRRVGVMRNPSIRGSGPNRRWMMAAAEREARARFTTFKTMAEADRSLRAPDGWMEQFKETGTHTAACPADRVTGYALWRTQTTGSDFAPDHYDPASCVGVVTDVAGFRAGDVIDEPGFRTPGRVEHEGRVVAAVRRNSDGAVTTVEFTDGTVAATSEFRAQFTVYRPTSPTEEAQLRRYREVAQRSDRTGHIPGQGWYAEDPDSGERVFDPWGV